MRRTTIFFAIISCLATGKAQEPVPYEKSLIYDVEEEYSTRSIEGTTHHHYHATYTSKEESVSHSCSFIMKGDKWVIKHLISYWHDGPLTGTQESLPTGTWDLWAELDYLEEIETINPAFPESVFEYFRDRSFADQAGFPRGTSIKMHKYALEGLPNKAITICFPEHKR